MSDLIDRKAFIEKERRLYCEDCDRRKGTKNGKPNVICYDIGEAPCRSCWLDDALTDLEDFPTASPWHMVEEPPKEGQNVLTMDANEDMEMAVYDGKRFFDSYGFYVTDVLYWMPIEPPKEDA